MQFPCSNALRHLIIKNKLIPEGFSLLKTEGLGAVSARIITENWQHSFRTGLPKTLLERETDFLQMATSQNSLRRIFSVLKVNIAMQS